MNIVKVNRTAVILLTFIIELPLKKKKFVLLNLSL